MQIRNKKTTRNIYTITNNKLQLNYNSEDPYRTDNFKSTNSHKGELTIAYNNKVINKITVPNVHDCTSYIITRME